MKTKGKISIEEE